MATNLHEENQKQEQEQSNEIRKLRKKYEKECEELKAEMDGITMWLT